MLIKAELHRDSNGKFGIFLCPNASGKPSIERIVTLDVKDTRHLLKPGDVVIEVNGINLSGVSSIIGVKEVRDCARKTSFFFLASAWRKLTEDGAALAPSFLFR